MTYDRAKAAALARIAREDEVELIEWGVTPVLQYDPLSRNIRTDLPNGTFRTVDFDPWQVTTHDENDNVIASDWWASPTPRR